MRLRQTYQRRVGRRHDQVKPQPRKGNAVAAVDGATRRGKSRSARCFILIPEVKTGEWPSRGEDSKYMK